MCFAKNIHIEFVIVVSSITNIVLSAHH